jgi:hypothetical protein
MKRITFDEHDLADCRRALGELWATVRHRHGPMAAQRLLKERTLSKDELRKDKDTLALNTFLASELSQRRFAAIAAKRTGVSREAVRIHIRRLLKGRSA